VRILIIIASILLLISTIPSGVVAEPLAPPKTLSTTPVVEMAQAKRGATSSIPRRDQQGQPLRDDTLKYKLNSWTLGLAAGQLEGAPIRFATELARVLDDGDNMRVLPIITRGVPANLDDLLYLRGVDIAVAQSDAFEYFRTNRKINNLNKRVNYILRFPIAEVQVIARPEIRSLEDLRGKKVDFGPPGTSTTLTTPLIFQRLGINVQEVKLPNPFTPAAYQRIAKGEADAAVRVSQKPLSHVAQIPPNSGLHLVSIPFNKVFADLYAIGEFTHEDYPNLVPEGQRVDTLAVPFVLAAYNWPKDSDRYRKVERFVVKLFENWEKLRQPPFAAKWRDINLAATVPGLPRFPATQEWLDRQARTPQKKE